MERPLFPLLAVLHLLSLLPLLAVSKSTIEPCSGSDSCPALLGYTLYADLKVSEVASLFQADPIAVLTANTVDISVPDIENHILPAGLFLRIPTRCSCSDGIRKSVSTRYTTRPADTLTSIATSIFAGLASPDQIREANGISDPSALDVGRTLVIPLPCTCFNSTDNNLPAIYLSYVVKAGDTVPAIADRYSTTATDIMNVNAMGNPAIRPGDIIAIPLPDDMTVGLRSYNIKATLGSRYASDFGLVVANGSYAVTASHCVQCSCGSGNLNLYCTPASLAVSCSSMQCRNSNLMLGNVTIRPSSVGCNVTSCLYGGFVNGTIITTLFTSLQPRCPGKYQFPALIPPPSVPVHESFLAPSVSPVHSQLGGAMTAPKTSVPGTLTLPGASPVNGPPGSTSGASINRFKHILVVFVVCQVLNFLL